MNCLDLSVRITSRYMFVLMIQYNVSFEIYMNIQYMKSCQENVTSKEWKTNNLAYYIMRNFAIYAGSLIILAGYLETKEIRIC